jgi:hypothetical protein
LDLNVAAALDPIGGLLGVAEFPTTKVSIRLAACWGWRSFPPPRLGAPFCWTG